MILMEGRVSLLDGPPVFPLKQPLARERPPLCVSRLAFNFLRDACCVYVLYLIMPSTMHSQTFFKIITLEPCSKLFESSKLMDHHYHKRLFVIFFFLIFRGQKSVHLKFAKFV